MKWAKRLLITLAVIGILGAIVLEVGRRVLGSRYVADQVATRLAQVSGGPVRVDSVEVGLGGSRLRGLRLFETESAGPSAEPWVMVEEVDADVTLWAALGGAATPRQIGRAHV